MPDSNEAHLPQVKHTISMTENPDGSGLILDISDETGGLGLKLYLHSSTASKLGQRMAERARFLTAKANGDSDRLATDTFIDAGDGYFIYPWPAPGSHLRKHEIQRLRCSHDGCVRDYTSPGGLKNIAIGGDREPANWRCQEHREAVDHSSHRLDLRMALDRSVEGEIKAILEDIKG